jgi:hypothetical protein
MHSLRYFKSFDLLVITYTEPFSATDSFGAARSADAREELTAGTSAH